MAAMVWLLAWLLSAQVGGFWCSMHPGERSPVPAACPICHMPMVAIPPFRVGEYPIDVALVPQRGSRGVAALRLVVRDPATRAVVTAFDTVHERTFHLFILGRDLEFFLHVHPEMRADGTFELTQALPPGEYVLVADFLPTGGVPQTVSRAILTPGFDPPPVRGSPARPLTAGPADVIVGGIRARLDAPAVAAGKDAHLQFTFSHAASGAPVTDLEPYLGSPAHLLMVNPDVTDAVHGHPEGEATSGPTVAFDVLVPAAGPFKLWVQIQRRGRVLTFPFTVVAR
jgi:hypothetical protein